MYQEILVPTDGSRGASRAAAHAVDLAAENDARVHALSVVTRRVRTDAWADVVGDPVAEDEVTTESVLRDRAEEAVEAVARRGKRRDVEVVTAVVDGRPHEAILDYADANDVDVIVMGTHGRSGLRRFLLGSVTEAVVRAADVPVLCITAESSTAVEDVETAREVAREELAKRGYEAVEFPEEPYRQRSSWVVSARADGQRFNVHVSVTGETSVARISDPPA